ncbi:alpha/beta hydrolase family protein [Pseudoalteromonas sp. T1lg65]|uniref:alpha/beta hydrolase family protein n=1 Tax=Pseudoalteromonas sp. T1lg65 TaxID=2077101 RepID=UPI003F7ACECD
MKFYYLLLALLLSCFNVAAKPDSPPYFSIEDFAKKSQYHQITLSPDGKHMSVILTNDNGDRVLTILRRKDMSMTTTLNWKGEEFPLSMSWLNNERVAVNVGMSLSSMDMPIATGEVVAMNIDGSKELILHGGRKKGKRNQAKTKAEKGRLIISDVAPESNDEIYVLTVPNGISYAEYKRINIYSGREYILEKSPVKGGGMLADHNRVARFAVGVEAHDNKNYHLLYYRDSEEDEWKEFGRYLEDEGVLSPLAFAPDNNTVYVASTIGRETQAIFKLDLKSKEKTLLSGHPLVDASDYLFDKNRKLVAVEYLPDYLEIDVIDDNSDLIKWLKPLQQFFKGHNVSITSMTSSMEELVVRVTADNEPGTYYLFDTKKQNISPLMQSFPHLDRKKIAKTQPIKFTARDGQDLHGYITLPLNQSKNLPLIVMPHGGPHGPRDNWQYDDQVSLLADHGYAVLRVNFRGSGGYGRSFQSSGYHNWHSTIMNDINDGVRFMIEQGTADKDRVCIFGHSFGGYSAVMAPIREPDLYKCAVASMGVYDMDILYKTGDTPGTIYGTNTLKKYVGTDPKLLHEASPARHVDKLTVPVMIVHGKKDPRADFEHALFLRKKLEEADKEYEWLVFDKEGHGYVNEQNKIEFFTKLLKFLDKHLK